MAEQLDFHPLALVERIEHMKETLLGPDHEDYKSLIPIDDEPYERWRQSIDVAPLQAVLESKDDSALMAYVLDDHDAAALIVQALGSVSFVFFDCDRYEVEYRRAANRLALDRTICGACLLGFELLDAEPED